MCNLDYCQNSEACLSNGEEGWKGTQEGGVLGKYEGQIEGYVADCKPQQKQHIL